MIFVVFWGGCLAPGAPAAVKQDTIANAPKKSSEAFWGVPGCSQSQPYWGGGGRFALLPGFGALAMIRYYARPGQNAARDESVLFVHAERIKCHNPGHKSNDHKNLSLHPTVLSAMHTTLPEIPHVNMRESWGTFEWKR